MRLLKVDKEHADLRISKQVTHRIEHAVTVVTRKGDDLTIDNTNKPGIAALIGHGWSALMINGRQKERVDPPQVSNSADNSAAGEPSGRACRTSTFERGCVDDVAYVRNLETMHETPPDVGQASTNRRVRLLSCDFGQSFRECCFHSDPRIESEGVVDQGRGDFLHTKSHDVDKGTEMDERDFRLPSVGDVGEGVERDRIPDDFSSCLSRRIDLGSPAIRVALPDRVCSNETTI